MLDFTVGEPNETVIGVRNYQFPFQFLESGDIDIIDSKEPSSADA